MLSSTPDLHLGVGAGHHAKIPNLGMVLRTDPQVKIRVEDTLCLGGVAKGNI